MGPVSCLKLLLGAEGIWGRDEEEPGVASARGLGGSGSVGSCAEEGGNVGCWPSSYWVKWMVERQLLGATVWNQGVLRRDGEEGGDEMRMEMRMSRKK